MDQNTLLYTLPQWLIFAAITASIYGWAEQKKIFSMIGPLLLISLGIFASFAIFRGSFSSFTYLTPEEIINEELSQDISSEIPIGAKIFPAYLSFIFSGILALPAFILQWKNKKFKNTFMIVSGLISLIGFFIIAGALHGGK